MTPQIPVNRTKIIVPALRPEVLHRKRFLRYFDDLLEKKLLIITAPAGYGKTTLLADMARRSEMSFCWLALDELDRDPQRFIAYLIAALTERFPRFGKQSLGALKRMFTFEQDAEQTLSTLINEVYEQIDEHFVLVLDDFQYIDSLTELGQFVSRFIMLAADHCHTIISSRRLPALPDITLMVARQQVIGFDLEELAFRPDEVRLLYSLDYAVRLEDGDVERLLRQTEGWITGLHLSAHTLTGTVPDLERTARVTRVNLAEYFDRQVLAIQPVHLRNFLLRTSLFETFDAGLCKTVLGEGNWKQCIRDIQNGNLFTMPVDAQGQSIRYHHLFQGFLQERFLAESPGEAETIRKRIAAFHEEQGDWERAYQIHSQNSDGAALAGLVERAGTAMLVSERLLTLRNWLDALPAAQIQVRPALQSLKGSLLCAIGDGKSALETLERPVTALREQRDIPGLALALIRRAAAKRLVGDYAGVLEDTAEVLELNRAVEGLGLLSAEALRYTGLAQYHMGQTTEAIQSLKHSLVRYELADEVQSIARLQLELGMAYRANGDYPAARKAYEAAMNTWRSENNLHSLAIVLNNLGVLHHTQGEYEAAVQALEDGLECARRAGSLWPQALLLTSLGDIYIELDELTSADAAYEMACGIAYQVSYQYLVNYISVAQAKLARLKGNYQEARLRLETASTFFQDNRSNSERGLFYLESGCLRLASGDPSQAITDLQQALDHYQRSDLIPDVALSRIWLAAAHLESGDPAAARTHIWEVFGDARTNQMPNYLVQAVRNTRQWLTGLTHDPDTAMLVSPWLEKARRTEARLPLLHKRIRQMRTTISISAPVLDIHALGKAQVKVNGQPVTSSRWQTSSVRNLFFYFLSSPRAANKEEVVEAFWPESNPMQLKLRFKNDLYRLRRALGSVVILFENDLYRFNNELDYTYDVETFETNIKRAKSAIDDDKIMLLSAALDLWDGPYLHDVDEPWVLPERERLLQLYLWAAKELAELHHRYGSSDKAAQVCQDALVADPCQEDFHRILMEIYAGRGDRAAVIRQYQACQNALRSELDLEPASETEALYRRLVN